MRINRIIFLFSILFFSITLAFAVPPKPPVHGKEYDNFRGRRMMDDDGPFRPVFVKITEVDSIVFFQVFFTQPVDASSLDDGSICIDGVPVNAIQVRFSKNCRGFRFFITEDKNAYDEADPEKNKYSLEIKNIKSIGGNIMEPLMLTDCEKDCEYHYLDKEELWKRY